MYNYKEAMVSDVMDYVKRNIMSENFENAGELEDYLTDHLWVEDSVTGNASGSYTFSRSKAREYVLDNLDLLEEALEEFGADDAETGRKFLAEDWEFFDVTIRCFLLSEAIYTAIEKMPLEYAEDHN